MANTIKYKAHILKQQPKDKIDPRQAFELVDREINLDTLKDGEIVLRTLYLSNEPAQRTWISGNLPADRHYTEPVKEGDVMRSYGIGKVIESKNHEYKKGDLAYAQVDWSEYTITDQPRYKLNEDIDPAQYIALSLTALTAYFGLLRVGEATSKDKTIVVSAAAGATGSVVAQIAKNVLGCKTVIGLAGSSEKCKILKEKCKVDVALNYKDDDFDEQFIKATPEYIDVYFDNVGGHILDLCVDRIARNGRVVACGSIASYDDEQGTAITAKSWFKVISMRAMIKGFIMSDFMKDIKSANEELQQWVKEGKLDPLKTVWETEFENVPEGMQKLQKGDNVGKLVTKLKVGNDSKL